VPIKINAANIVRFILSRGCDSAHSPPAKSTPSENSNLLSVKQFEQGGCSVGKVRTREEETSPIEGVLSFAEFERVAQTWSLARSRLPD
jgi:hypothetical protein